MLVIVARERRRRLTGIAPSPGEASVAHHPGSSVVMVVLFARSLTLHGSPCYLWLVGAFLGAVHGAGKGGGNPFGVWHRIDAPRFSPARGARHRVARLSERALLLEWPAILTDKVVDRHLVSPIPSALYVPKRRAVRFNHNHKLSTDHELTVSDHDHASCIDASSGSL